MELIATDSSMFSHYGYSIEHQTLTVQYRTTGERYTYQGISPEFYEEFNESDSKGKFFNAKIKGHFTAIKEEEVAAPIQELECGTVVPGAPVPMRICHECGVNVPGLEPCYCCGAPAAETLEVEPSSAGDITVETLQHAYANDARQSATDEILGDMNQALAVEPKPKVMAELPEPKTPAEAIAMLGEEAGYVGATIAQAKDAAQQGLAIRVSDAESYAKAGTMLINLTGLRDRAFKFLDPIRKVLFNPYSLAQSKVKEACDPLDDALKHVKRQRTAWSTEQERLAEVERQRLQKIADDEAKRQQAERTQELTLQEAQDRLDQGDEQGAAEVLEKPIQAAPVYVPPVRMETPVAKTEGVSKRQNWKCIVDDLSALVIDVAEGICDLAKTGKLNGHAPLNVLEANQTALNKLASAQQEAFTVPGCRAYNDVIEVVRRGKK